MTGSPLDAWRRTEQHFAHDLYTGRPRPVTVDGDSGILLIAPHAVWHTRDGCRKAPDLGTGGLAVTAAHLAGASAIAQSGSEPHWRTWAERGDVFTTLLLPRIDRAHLVLDIHGMSDEHGPDACIGRGPHPGPAVHRATKVIGDAFAGYTVTIDTPFDGTADFTVTSLAQNHGTPALQMELSRRLRSITGPFAADDVERLASAVHRLALPRTSLA